VQSLLRIPHTFFDAYFIGRYAQDVCTDGSIFVDRDGQHFGHVLEYMRDGVVSVAEPGARPSIDLLRALKREFGFYCIELCVEQEALQELPECAYVIGGSGLDDDYLTSVERYDALSGRWSVAAAMGTGRRGCGVCVLSGGIYVTGGIRELMRFDPATDTWCTLEPLPMDMKAGASFVLDGILYASGGGNRNSNVKRYDVTNDTWTAVADMLHGRKFFGAVTIGSAGSAEEQDLFESLIAKASARRP
jgi:hypothetical protein